MYDEDHDSTYCFNLLIQPRCLLTPPTSSVHHPDPFGFCVQRARGRQDDARGRHFLYGKSKLRGETPAWPYWYDFMYDEDHDSTYFFNLLIQPRCFNPLFQSVVSTCCFNPFFQPVVSTLWFQPVVSLQRGVHEVEKMVFEDDTNCLFSALLVYRRLLFAPSPLAVRKQGRGPRRL